MCADATQGVVESLDFGVRTIAPSITSIVSTSPMLNPKLASRSGGKSMMTSPLPPQDLGISLSSAWLRS